jgi:hypothetical protein
MSQNTLRITAFYGDKLLSKGNIKHSRINGMIILGRGLTISSGLGVKILL